MNEQIKNTIMNEQIKNIIEKSHNKELIAKKISEITELVMDMYDLAFESGYNLAIKLGSDKDVEDKRNS